MSGSPLVAGPRGGGELDTKRTRLGERKYAAEAKAFYRRNGLAKPIFFFRVSFFRGLAMVAAPGGDLAGMIEPVLGSMGYELVDVEFGGGGLLRVVIDVVGGERAVQLEDCERVSHQLSRLFTVEDVDYARLEISSPGLDRPLRKPEDFERFAGERVSMRLRRPVDGRRQFTGVLEREVVEDSGASRWVLHWSDEPVTPARGRSRSKAGARAGSSPRAGRGARKAAGKDAGGAAGASTNPGGGGRLEFTLDQVEKARLVPKLAF